MKRIVNFVFIHLVLSRCELNSGLVYRMAGGSDCLKPNRYTYVKAAADRVYSLRLSDHPEGNWIVSQ